jgi:pilus assembly protein CpaB
MRIGTVITLTSAVVFGTGAVLLTKTYLEGQRAAIARAGQPVVTDTLVVAAEPLRFGQRLSSAVLTEIPWPSKQRPSGSFATVEEMTREGDRFALSAIEAAEPILNAKITGPGQRATLSATLDKGMKAMAIRVNDVNGVAGFVLPGDRVDVLLTRSTNSQSGDTNTFVDVLLQGVKVIAIDQLADERAETPAIARTVTLEVDTPMAQRLTLAQAVGQLSLALRQVASPSVEQTRRVSLADLTGEATAPDLEAKPSVTEARFQEIEELVTDVGSSLGNRIEDIKKELNGSAAPVSRSTVVNVYRNAQLTEYPVSTE